MEELKENKEQQEIDTVEILSKIWIKRRLVIKSAIFGAFLGLIIAFSIPKEYDVTVTLSPESGKSKSSGLKDLASQFGFGGLDDKSDFDALNVMLFPDIISSDPFALELYSMKVKTEDGDTYSTLSEYIENNKKPWWGYITSLPSKVIGGIVSLIKGKKDDNNSSLDPFKLTMKERIKLEFIKKSILTNVDKKTGVTTITVKMQDPVVVATVADSVVKKLQSYITQYRTKKAIYDFEYWDKLCKERQQEYYDIQRKYAYYVDENKGLYTQKSKVESERLRNDMEIAYQTYNQVAKSLQMARGKIQEAKPVFAIINPATVPVKASSPKKVVILTSFIMLFVLISSGWIISKEEIKRTISRIIHNK